MQVQSTRWYLYREHFSFGTMDAYQMADRSAFWFVTGHGRTSRSRRYYTPQRMARLLERTWQPPWSWQNLGMVASEYAGTIAQLAAMPSI